MTSSYEQPSEWRNDRRAEITAIVVQLFSHFYVPTTNEAQMTSIIEDWVADLLPFGAHIVANACAEYRRRPGVKRPHLGDVCELCRQAKRDHAPRHGLVALPTMSETERQLRRADVENTNRRYRRAETWRRLGGSNWEHQQLARLAEAAGYETWQAYFALDETGARHTHARWQQERNRILEEA